MMKEVMHAVMTSVNALKKSSEAKVAPMPSNNQLLEHEQTTCPVSAMLLLVKSQCGLQITRRRLLIFLTLDANIQLAGIRSSDGRRREINELT